MAIDTAQHHATQTPINRPWLNSSAIFDRLSLSGPARGKRAELLILTARINFNP